MTDTFDVVRCFDAVVIDTCDRDLLTEYTYHRDIAKLLLPADARPVIFQCRVLKRSEVRKVKRCLTDEEVREKAFLFGVVSVRNVPGPGGRLTDHVPTHLKDGGMDDTQLDAMGVGPNDISEVGEVIVRRSFLGLGEELSCPPPATSLHAFGVMVTRHAERTRALPTPTADSGE